MYMFQNWEVHDCLDLSMASSAPRAYTVFLFSSFSSFCFLFSPILSALLPSVLSLFCIIEDGPPCASREDIP